jgi:predicted dienelactone hydrolase
MNRVVGLLQKSLLYITPAVLLVTLVTVGHHSVLAMGVVTLPASPQGPGSVISTGPITIWYPSKAPETPRTMGAFAFNAAWDAPAERGNGALVILSHGSGGSAMTYDDMARVLVDAGFVVACPEHSGDNWQDQSKTGPASWQIRPAEVSRTIDRIMVDARIAPYLQPGRVGIYGMSAGGLTALAFSGATWSLDRLVKHCADHFDEDAGMCAFRELAASHGKPDNETLQHSKAEYTMGAKSGMVDPKEYGANDSRVKAVVAAVPVTAVIDPGSLRAPLVPTALIAAEHDQVLAPKWHVLSVAKSCPTCVTLDTLRGGGHLSILSPLPAIVAKDLGPWAQDPAGFDRMSLPLLYKKIAQFFLDHL